jgi:WhiB family redox-sensing transcriptional regulator
MAAIEFPLMDEPELPADQKWVTHAACKGQTYLFFAPRAERPQARMRRETLAQDVCRTCPVVEPCRETARALREYGYWGGESEEDRHVAGFTVAAPIGVRARVITEFNAESFG